MGRLKARVRLVKIAPENRAMAVIGARLSKCGISRENAPKMINPIMGRNRKFIDILIWDAKLSIFIVEKRF